MKKLLSKFYKHPIMISLIFSIVIVFFIITCIGIFNGVLISEILLQYYQVTLIIGVFVLYPLIITLLNCFFIFRRKVSEIKIKAEKTVELVTIILGSFFSMLYLTFGFSDIRFADWNEVIYNSQLHSPINKSTLPTIILIALIALSGYFILRYIPLKKMPPLIIVLAISAMYLGIIECIIWSIQLFQRSIVIMVLCLFPFNFIIIAVKTVKDLVIQWKDEHPIKEEVKKHKDNPMLLYLINILRNSTNWPWLSLLFMVPLLGVIIAILALFGQAPDSVIKAWTETADWNLSQRIAPQNIQVDEHYLCTVAAGGHKKVVKPLRLGRRHGHEVIVNRQLCIANAFEQILEERVPSMHRFIRSLYDNYGYPFAKHIHSPYIADIIYVLMKPAEWFFIFVIYLCDVKPENRIAVQYLPKSINQVYK